MKNLFFILSLTLAIVGCSSGRQAPTQPGLNSATARLTQLSDSPAIYQTELEGVYATTLRECGIQDHTPNKSLARELFVGFDNPIIVSQGEKKLNNKLVLSTFANATLDGTPVSILVYTTKQDDCVDDILFWASTAEQLVQDKIDAITQELIS